MQFNLLDGAAMEGPRRLMRLTPGSRIHESFGGEPFLPCQEGEQVKPQMQRRFAIIPRCSSLPPRSVETSRWRNCGEVPIGSRPVIALKEMLRPARRSALRAAANGGNGPSLLGSGELGGRRAATDLIAAVSP